MLLPDKMLVKHLLQRYRAWERLMLAEPFNQTRRRHFEDTAYTLCVLMGRRTALEAATAAEDFLRPPHRARVRREPVSPDDRRRQPDFADALDSGAARGS